MSFLLFMCCEFFLACSVFWGHVDGDVDLLSDGGSDLCVEQAGLEA